MDDATKNRIITIVKDMSSQGMSNADIEENLRTMGIVDADIHAVMADIGGPAPLEPPVDEQPIEPIMEADEHIERLHSTVGDLHSKQDMQSGDIGAIREDLEALRQDMAEIKPMLAAMKRLNQNLIDVNKKMLVKYGAAPKKKKLRRKAPAEEGEYEE